MEIEKRVRCRTDENISCQCVDQDGIFPRKKYSLMKLTQNAEKGHNRHCYALK